ncbi:hypothetical protein PYWP30_01012 [Pyrobaculum sp. WP30]|nr:hypothetical protein PYWP30_01012 [Pyrobaculum sp. WP30]
MIQLTNTKIAMRSEPKVLQSVKAKYAGAYAQSGAAVAKKLYLQYTRRNLQNLTTPYKTQRTIAPRL